jgi:GNAT superfamily N-acetyltransferase
MAGVPEGESTTLPDGAELVISRLTPADAPVLAEGFARLSAESRRLRFLTAKPTLTPSELRYLTEVDGHDHEALGAVDPVTHRGVAVARFVRDEADQTRAEAAITVADDWQRRGVGKLMLKHLADRARSEGITRFTALVSGDNRGMQALFKHLGGPVHVARLGGGTYEYEVELGPRGVAGQLEAALRGAAAGHLPLPPRLRDVLRNLVPLHLGR